MANTMDLLGALLKRGLSDSSAQRIEHSMSEKGGLSEILEREVGATPAKVPAGAQSSSKGSSAASGGQESLGASLTDLARSMFGDGAKKNSIAAAGLGALLGSLFGGGAKSAAGAVGGGALALLGSIALKALGIGGQPNQKSALDDSTKLMAGLREPTNAEEQKQVASIADLTVKAMINAAKADGRIDEDELQKIVGEMQEDGITQSEREYLLNEVRKPMHTDEIVRAVANRQVAAQIYAASLLAIEVDTPAEKAYLEQLARDLKLDSNVVSQIRATLGVAV